MYNKAPLCSLTEISIMPRIVLKSIEFGDIPFRRLKKIKIDIAPRITLISGHNGIGKSTILGLLANSSGLTQRKNEKYPQTYANRNFEANLKEIIFIDYEVEFLSKTEKERPGPIVTYLINENEEIKKRCALTDRKQRSEARIVPRNFSPAKEFTSSDQSIIIGDSAKVPLPTIYLGTTRILPIGEAKEKAVRSEAISNMNSEDSKLLTDFINKIIIGIDANENSITGHRIIGTSKFSSHPQYGFNTKGVSLGQDSLGSIASAIVSFQKLKREWPSYPGGLLIIDELDIGFHPHAIRRLVKELEDCAEKLDLQIIATTHSTTLIEAVFPKPGSKKQKDQVIYLKDTIQPYLDRSPPSLVDILMDMNLLPPGKPTNKKDVLNVYLEDDEAKMMFDTIISKTVKTRISKTYSVIVKSCALCASGSSLAKFPIIDKHFRTSIFVLDSDVKLPKQKKHGAHGNIILLPGEYSPERTLFCYLTDMIEKHDQHETAWGKLREISIHTNHILEIMEEDRNDILSDRVIAKKWWTRHIEKIKNWSLLELWQLENESDINKFISSFEKIVGNLSKEIRKNNYILRKFNNMNQRVI